VFYTVFVSTSIAKGLIDLDHLHAAGMAPISDLADPHGHNCLVRQPEQATREHCDCLRRFHDPKPGAGIRTASAMSTDMPVRTDRLFASAQLPVASDPPGAR